MDSDRIQKCALNWAIESNNFTCIYVYGDEFSEKVDLGGPYFDGAIPIVETQVAKGKNALLYN